MSTIRFQVGNTEVRIIIKSGVAAYHYLWSGFRRHSFQHVSLVAQYFFRDGGGCRFLIRFVLTEKVKLVVYVDLHYISHSSSWVKTVVDDRQEKISNYRRKNPDAAITKKGKALPAYSWWNLAILEEKYLETPLFSVTNLFNCEYLLCTIILRNVTSQHEPFTFLLSNSVSRLALGKIGIRYFRCLLICSGLNNRQNGVIKDLAKILHLMNGWSFSTYDQVVHQNMVRELWQNWRASGSRRRSSLKIPFFCAHDISIFTNCLIVDNILRWSAETRWSLIALSIGKYVH